MVYPRFRNKDIAALTLAQLLKADPIKNRLGTTFNVPPPSDPDNFRTNIGIPIISARASSANGMKLEEFLSSSSGNSNEATASVAPCTEVGPKVLQVEIHGRFSVLSTGIILVDLPGHGDNDDNRNNFAADYVKTADGVILVTDAKRAQNDRDTHSYLRKTLNQVIMDGRSIEDFVVLAATGTDVRHSTVMTIFANGISAPDWRRRDPP
ncbi:hypothetical protein B0H19DRAFT_1064152 [Mycena capillaripes]|nr:hypothetical protein B0H19DRAFT_1064152 [Mycena capillaripes]